jgi:hypothetical protein
MTGMATGRRDLDIGGARLVVLRIVQGLQSTLAGRSSIFAQKIYAAVEPAFLQISNFALSEIVCPYGNPPAKIIMDFDSSKNMYQRCLHGDPYGTHCWDHGGKLIDCPP